LPKRKEAIYIEGKQQQKRVSSKINNLEDVE